jgi:beta-xylosidase
MPDRKWVPINKMPRQQAKWLIVLLLYSVFSQVSLGNNQQTTNKSSVWVPDNGGGTYKNPIIFADYSDPDVERVGEDFYMVASSFNHSLGLPVLHSKDLVNWTIIGHVFQKYPFEKFSTPQHGNGVWAPSIRYHKGEFYIYFGDPDSGIFMTKAKNPAVPWRQLTCVKEGKGLIDACPFWDDDGNAYVVHAWAKSRAGFNSILTIKRMSADGTKVLDEGKTVFDGKLNHPTIEGPKLHKRNGYYYIFAPAGGVATGWQTVLRSKNIFGPYEDRIVLAQGKTEINGPHQGAWVELKSGQSWFIHFQNRGAYGRIIHLQPVKWANDWPVIGVNADGDGKGEPVLSYRKPNVGKSYSVTIPQTSDEFQSKKLGLQWQWQANYKDEWMSLKERKDWLRLYAIDVPDATANLWNVANLVLQKLPAEEFTVTTKMNFSKLAVGEKTGLMVFGMDYSYLAIEKTTAGYRLFQVSCKNANNNGKESTTGNSDYASDSIILKVTVRKGAVCRFSYSSDGKEFIEIGESFTAREGRWVGAKIGLFCVSQNVVQKSGYADFDWFRFA